MTSFQGERGNGGPRGPTGPAGAPVSICREALTVSDPFFGLRTSYEVPGLVKSSQVKSIYFLITPTQGNSAND